MSSKKIASKVGQSFSEQAVPAFDHFVKKKAAAEVKDKQKRGEAPHPEPETIGSQTAVDSSKAAEPAYKSYVKQKMG